MIIGTLRRMEEEDDPEYYRDQMYRHDLDMFEGNDGYNIGILDDLENMKKLISLIGKGVILEEQEFAEIWNERDPERVVMPGDDVTENYYKKLFRPFSYRAIFMLIHSVFENAVEDLRNLMIKAGRYPLQSKDNGLIETLKEFKSLEGYDGEFHDTLRMFSFLRNKVAHNKGYFNKQGEKVQFQELEKFVKGREDILVTKSSQTGYSHQVIIQQSTVLVDYIDLITKIIKQLIRAAINAPYLGSATNQS